MAGADDPSVLKQVNVRVRKARAQAVMRYPRLRCDLDEVIIVTPSDGAYGAMPGGSSQQGLVVAIAEPAILDGVGRLNLLEWSSTKVKRVARSSMAAEVSAATTAFEHGDIVRVVLAEMLQPDFELRLWRNCVGAWRQFSVVDAKCAFDSVNSDLLPSDKRVAIDVAVLREAIINEGTWSLVENEELVALRAEARIRQKESKTRLKTRRVEETKDLPAEGKG
jgi:hypothetical protein